jgi:hypothetical protein
VSAPGIFWCKSARYPTLESYLEAQKPKSFRVVCCGTPSKPCGRFLHGDPDGTESHTVGPCCWDAYREEAGLPAKPYGGKS